MKNIYLNYTYFIFLTSSIKLIFIISLSTLTSNVHRLSYKISVCMIIEIKQR